MKHRIYKLLIISILLISGTFNVQAQKPAGLSTKNKKAISNYHESENYIIRKQYSKAVELLQESVKRDPKFAEAHLRLGTLYKSLDKPDLALLHFEKAVALKPDDMMFIGGYYALAEHYFSLGKYSNADEFLKNIISKNPQDPRIRKDVQNLQENVDFASENINKPLSFDPKPLPQHINQYNFQNFPVLTADQQTLIFTRLYKYEPQYDEDIYISHKIEGDNGKLQWSEPASISPKINTKANEGTCTISADGKMLIFTSCQGRKSFGSCDLYVSFKIGNEWSEPVNLGPKVNSSAWESQPSLSADGRTLYFVSNRPGGRGKRDIWYSRINSSGEWSSAENLGPEINTEEDEVSPFIHVNGQTLYFASKGFPGFGGFDLYFVEKKDFGWTAPKNLGYPLNNYNDQISLFITSDGKKGYYSHEQKRADTYHSSFIFEFDVPEEIQVTNKSNYVAGKVYDADTKKPLDAEIELYDLALDELVSQVSSDPVNGDYLMVLTEGSEYALFISRKDYLFESLNFNYSDSNSEKEPVIIDIYLHPIKTGESAILKNIFFDTDKYDLKNKSKTELTKVVKFLNANPQLKVEIAGFSDNQGAESYNKALSLNRAKAVFEYLKESGIQGERLSFKGYGQSDPVAPNDNEENRQKNRRIEFKLIKAG
ncbi:MAG: OmpA family protein [Bacteroidota bacterium]|nr:OmpA family protein [Bacteroidota bacterium]